MCPALLLSKNVNLPVSKFDLNLGRLLDIFNLFERLQHKKSCFSFSLFGKMLAQSSLRRRKMLELEGRVWKDPTSLWWRGEVSFLNVMTQGKTRQEALKMIKDAVIELLKDAYEDFFDQRCELKVTLYKEKLIGLKSDEFLFALGLSNLSGFAIHDRPEAQVNIA